MSSKVDDMRPRGHIIRCYLDKPDKEQQALVEARPFDYWIWCTNYHGWDRSLLVATRIERVDKRNGWPGESNRYGEYHYLSLAETADVADVFHYYKHIFSLSVFKDARFAIAMKLTDPWFSPFGRPEPHWYCAVVKFDGNPYKRAENPKRMDLYTTEAAWHNPNGLPVNELMHYEKFEFTGFVSARDYERRLAPPTCEIIVRDVNVLVDLSPPYKQRLLQWTLEPPVYFRHADCGMVRWRGPANSLPPLESLRADHITLYENPSISHSIEYTQKPDLYIKISAPGFDFKTARIDDGTQTDINIHKYYMNRRHMKTLVIFPVVLALCDIIPSPYVLMWIVNFLPGMRLLRDKETTQFIDKLIVLRRTQLEDREKLKVARV